MGGEGGGRWVGGKERGRRWMFALKWSSSFKSPSMILPEGNLSSFIFILSRLSSPLMQLLWILPKKKVSLDATPKIFRRAKASLFFVFSHYHPIMCLPSPE